jgi:hypothetical protein
LQNCFAVRALSIIASRWTLAILLRSQSTPQNQEMTFAFVLADQLWPSLSCSQINLFRRKWRNKKIEISRTKIYESNFETISKNEQRQHSKKQQSTYWEHFELIYENATYESWSMKERRLQNHFMTYYKKSRKHPESKKR